MSEGYNILFGPACSGNVQAVNDERVGRVYAIQKKRYYRCMDAYMRQRLTRGASHV